MGRNENGNRSDSERLMALRERLGLSQRELADEFKVSPGAVALWEKASRPVPGPVLKLIELYERYLDGEEENPLDNEIRRVSASWTKRLLGVVSPKQQRDPELQSKVQSQIGGILHRELSKESWKRSIQLSIAEKLVESIGESKGLPMKIAQLASYVDLGLPQEFRDTLATLQTMSPPMSPTVAARVFYEEIGRAPHEVFSEWEHRPFAAASIGQVHRARLRTGELVAVKIQYPGIEESITKDFSRIEFFQRLATLLRERDPEALNELKKHVIAECDYSREAANQERMAAYFDGHPLIHIPKIHPQLTRSRVITQEFVEGVHLQRFVEMSTRDQRQRAAKAIEEFFSHGFFLSGHLHADPHPGNFLFTGERVAILDFGRVVELRPEDSRNFRDIWLATVNNDREGCREVFRRMDVVKDWNRFDFESFWDLTRAVHQNHLADGEFEMNPEFTRACIEKMQRFPQKREIRSPAGFLWSNTVHLGTWYLLSELRAKFNWKQGTLDIIGRMPADGYLSHWKQGR